MLDDGRMTALLVKLRKDGVRERTIANTFSYAAVVAAISATEDLTDGQARRALTEWLAGRGEIVSEAGDAAYVAIHEVAWNELVDAHP